MSCFYVLGTDKRTENIKKMYENEGELVNNLKDARYVILPTPFTKDRKNIFGTYVSIEEILKDCIGKTIFSGAIPNIVKEKMQISNIKYYDLMEYEDVAILNAIPTAEGAIAAAMEMSDITLNGSNCLVLGFGKIGKILSKMLQGIGAKVYCEARKEKDLAQILAMGYNSIDLKDLDKYLSKFDFVFNTIPYLVLNKSRLEKLKEEAYIIDLASMPGGVDFEYAKKIGVEVNHALALPSKVAPKTAAMYLKQKIDYIICNN